MQIKELTLKFFKGQKEKTVSLKGNARITGSNGAGKTTLATAWYWLMADRDYDLHSNPNIRPLDVEECTPRVEAVLDINGKPVTITKQQVMKKSKPNADGISKVSLTNSYEINSVPKSEKDFKAYLADLGVDNDLFLALSHPEVFTGQKAPEMRKILFSLTSAKSDYDIAEKMSDVDDVKDLLRNYTADEIKAMQNATLRKIREDYGKDGEILRAKIEGLETAKVDVDVAELELYEKELARRLANNLNKQADSNVLLKELDAKSAGIIELKMKQADMQREANMTAEKTRGDIRNELVSLDNQKHILEHSLRVAESTKNECDDNIKLLTEKLQKCRDEWSAVNASKFDEGSLFCQFCKQPLPESDAEERRKAFEDGKTNQLAQITNAGTAISEMLKNRRKELGDALDEIATLKEKLENLSITISDLENELDAVKMVDVSTTPEYMAIQDEIEKIQTELTGVDAITNRRRELQAEQAELLQEIRNNDAKMATFKNNIRIDEQISELRERQAEYEQSRADAENILYQIDLLSRRKNELLEADINSHFEIVKWKLYEYQKNGEYKEVCIPQYNGKDLNVSTNTGLEMLMKLDIIKGLQKHYKQYYPVFLDGAEALSQDSMAKINMDCQMIYLVVDENKELVIS